MLDLLRNNSRSFVIYLMFAIIIVVFAFTFGAAGPDQACGGGGPGLQAADLAEVDGQRIDTGMLLLADEVSFTPPGPKSTSQSAQEARRDYLTTRFGQLGLYGRFAGATFGRDLEDVSPVKAIKLMDELVETQLVASYARELGMTISNREMSDRLALLTRNYVDEKTGKFDEDAWTNFMRRLNTTPALFERFVKDELLRERVIALMVGGVTVTDAELGAEQKLTGDKVKIEYVAIDPASVAPLAKVSDEEISAWLTKNGEKADKQYQDEKDSRFTTPKQWTLRVLKVDAPDASAAEGDEKTTLEAARAEAKTKAEKALADIKAAMPASADAPAPADAPTDAPAPAPADAPADAPTPADAPAPADAPPTTETPADIFGRLAAAVSDHPSKAEGGLLSTPYDAEALARWPFGAPVQQAVSSLAAGQMTELVEVPSGFWILFVEKVTEPVVKSLEEARQELAREAIRAEKAPELTKVVAAEVLAEAKKDPTQKLEVAAAAVSSKYGVAGAEALAAKEARPFSRLESLAEGFPLQLPFIANLGRSADLVRAAFAASAEKPLLDATFPLESGDTTILVARFLETVPAEPMTDEAKKELRERLTFEAQRRIYRAWYEGYLAAKLASGDVEYSTAWLEEKRRQEEAYRQAGGVLKEDQEKPAAATPAEAPAAAPAKP